MDFNEIYHFIFETYEGIACLIGCGFVFSIIFAFISEKKTKKTFKDRGEKTNKQHFEDNDNDDSDDE